RRAYATGRGKGGNNSRNRIIHRAGWDDLIADEPSLRTVAFKAPLIEDCLARNAISGKARHAHVRRARNDAFLARGQGHEGIALSQYVVHYEQKLAMTTDG